MFVILKRVFKFAWTDFYRNRQANIAAIFVLLITSSLVTALFFFKGITQAFISQVQERIDITAYFKENVSEEEILETREEILKLSPEIKSIVYISKEEALSKFIKRHQNNEIFMKALEEVGKNPFLASLNIKVKLPEQYDDISKFLKTSQLKERIVKVDYYQKKPIIEKIFFITSTVEKIGLVLSLILVILTISVVFNTIKLTTTDSKEEISIMKLVGASNWFVRMRFLIQGGIAGFFAFLICFLFFFLILFFLTSKLEILLPEFNLFNYFIGNFWLIISIQLAFSVGLGIISGLIVVRRHLNF